jgi:hypothetical protein
MLLIERRQQNLNELKIKLFRFKIKIECILRRLMQDNSIKTVQNGLIEFISNTNDAPLMRINLTAMAS